jgi:hypothetical protein
MRTTKILCWLLNEITFAYKFKTLFERALIVLSHFVARCLYDFLNVTFLIALRRTRTMALNQLGFFSFFLKIQRIHLKLNSAAKIYGSIIFLETHKNFPCSYSCHFFNTQVCQADNK